MSNQAVVQTEPSGFSFDRADVSRIKSRLSPFGETMTYITRLEAVVRAAHDYYWNMPVEEDAGDERRGEALKQALAQVHWTEGIPLSE